MGEIGASNLGLLHILFVEKMKIISGLGLLTISFCPILLGVLFAALSAAHFSVM